MRTLNPPHLPWSLFLKQKNDLPSTTRIQDSYFKSTILEFVYKLLFFMVDRAPWWSVRADLFCQGQEKEEDRRVLRNKVAVCLQAARLTTGNQSTVTVSHHVLLIASSFYWPRSGDLGRDEQKRTTKKHLRISYCLSFFLLLWDSRESEYKNIRLEIAHRKIIWLVQEILKMSLWLYKLSFFMFVYVKCVSYKPSQSQTTFLCLKEGRLAYNKKAVLKLSSSL